MEKPDWRYVVTAEHIEWGEPRFYTHWDLIPPHLREHAIPYDEWYAEQKAKGLVH